MRKKITRKPGKNPKTTQKNEGAELGKAFGVRICELRKARGWSQEHLADRCDIHRSHMGQIERGEVDPALSTLGKIVKGLEAKPGEVLDALL